MTRPSKSLLLSSKEWTNCLNILSRANTSNSCSTQSNKRPLKTCASTVNKKRSWAYKSTLLPLSRVTVNLPIKSKALKLSIYPDKAVKLQSKAANHISLPGKTLLRGSLAKLNQLHKMLIRWKALYLKLKSLGSGSTVLIKLGCSDDSRTCLVELRMRHWKSANKSLRLS